MKLALAACIALVGCYHPLVPEGVPCSDTGECPAGQACDPLTRTCMLPTELLTWRDDTAADFGTAGARMRDTVVESAGFVGPMPYLTGRLRLAGIASDVIGDVTTATWDPIAAATITGHSFTNRVVVDYGVDAPYGVGLVATDGVTVVVEGEIFLDAAGTWNFELTANDKGFVEIAPPDTTDFTRVVTDLNVTTTGAYTVVTPGWHPIRAAFADNNQYMDFDVRVDPPNVAGGMLEVPSDRIRARVDDLTGAVLDGFDNAHMIDYMASTLATDSLASPTIAMMDPYGLPVGAGSFVLHWTSQVLIDVDGDYTFRIQSHHGHRGWLDGTPLGGMFLSADEDTTSPSIHLVPGWHDLVVDLNKNGGTAVGALAMTIASGPTWVGQGIPVDHLRPVAGRDVRWTDAVFSGSIAVPDGGTGTATVTLDLPANMIPIRVDTAFEVDHPLLPTVQVVLDPPVGANITRASTGSITGTGTYYQHDLAPTGDAGATWNLLVTDSTVEATTGAITYAAVTLVCSGGLAPFPIKARYESAPKDLGDPVAFGAVHWAVRQGPIGAATVEIRTCDTLAACATEPWTPVAEGATPTTAVRTFAQYAVELTTDGDVPTALDWISLDYTAHVP